MSSFEIGPTRPVGATPASAPIPSGPAPSIPAVAATAVPGPAVATASPAAAAPAPAAPPASAEKAVATSDATRAGDVPVQSERVAQIRRAIEEGRYPVLPVTIADAMIAAGMLLRTPE